MKKNYSKFHGLSKLIALFALVLMTQNISAQCSLGCNGNIQLSLNEDCEGLVTPAMLLNDTTSTCPNGVFTVELYDAQGNLVAQGNPAIVGSGYINQTLTAKVIDMISNNSCWGNVHVEDKLAPQIVCVADTIDCWEMPSFLPSASDNCGTPSIKPISPMIENPLDCDPLYVQYVTGSFQATDDSGNLSDVCTIDIYLRRPDLSTVNWPTHFDIAPGNNAPIQCDFDYPPDDKGNPHPSYTGVPVLGSGPNALPLYGNEDAIACNLFTTYTDVTFPFVGGVKKIMRQWTISEWWCGQSIPTMQMQIIEIVDNQGPVFTCPDDMSVATTAGLNCEAYVYLPSVELTDNCSTKPLRLDMTYPGGFDQDKNGGYVTLPVGNNEITYTSYDEHLNSNTCTFYVEVSDKTAPTPVCDQYTVVSLSVDGTAIVKAKSFDDGSHDECSSELIYKVRRMDGKTDCVGGQNNNSNVFFDTATFCCSDTGNVVVTLRVYDEAGNYNDCMVNVEVQDKLKPQFVSCPADTTVECDFPYDIDNLSAVFGTPVVHDNCDYTLTESQVVNINTCGEGRIRRIFRASDENGTSTCFQNIFFENFDPFYGTTDINWPSNITLNGCIDPYTLTPENSGGYPTYTKDACDKVLADHDDKVFTIVNGESSCAKVLRTWTVIDWCQKDKNGLYIEWKHQQEILITSDEIPSIAGDFADKTVCTYDEQCQDGFIELSASATGGCPAQYLTWKYLVDYNNDGSYDFTSTSVVAEGINANGNYPIGTHRIVYVVEDGCGHEVRQEQIFTIANCKKPTPYCLNGLAIALMPVDTDNDGNADTGMVEIWASDFDNGSFHPCAQFPVEVSFSTDINDKSRTFTCDNLGENTVNIYASIVLPDGTILQDYCTASLTIQDNNDVCDGGNSQAIKVNVQGKITNESNASFNAAAVQLEGGELNTTTDNSGLYAFNDMPTGGAYKVIPTKDGNDVNGVTTLDIILIQKHILGLQELPTPYKIIAADVNNDNKITGSDIVQLRKLILGIISENQYLDAWRFVDKNYNFVDKENPLLEDFTEAYDIDKLTSNMNIDFVALKVGDVNETANPGLISNNVDTRSGESITLNIEDKAFNAGDVVRIDVTTEQFNSMVGFQFTTTFDQNVLSFEAVESGMLTDFDMSNVGLNNLNAGKLVTSWNTGKEISLTGDDVLFTYVMKANADGTVADVIDVNSAELNAAAYTNNLDVLDIKLRFGDNETKNASYDFELLQNVPNPFSTTTTISFTLPSTQYVELAILDVSGTTINTIEGVYSAGLNTLKINVEDLKVNGVLYYQLTTEGYTATKKMVVVK